MTTCQRKNLDTIYDVDHQYHLAEADAKQSWIPEEFGSRRIGLALVGVGRMGAIHLYNVLREPRAKLMYIMDADEKRLEYLRKKYHLDEFNVRALILNQWQLVLDDKQVEALLISTPTSTHEQYIKDGLRHSKHILCEKPLANETETIKSILATANQTKMTLLVAFNRRFDATFRNIKRQAKRGDIGNVKMIKICSRNCPPPSMAYIRTSGGVFHDTCVHDFDIILWLAEELPIEVFSYAHAHSQDYKDCDDFDTVVINMKFKSGLLTISDTSRFSNCGYEQRMELFGSKGVLKVDECFKMNYELHTEIGLTKPHQYYSFASRYQEAYASEIKELFNHIEGNRTLETRNDKYLPALNKIIDAAEKSARSGQPIKLKWAEEEYCF